MEVEVNQANFLFWKDCLKRFNYPKVHTLDDSEVADVFSESNREFLVKWMLKQINGDYEELVDNTTKETLGDILYQHGFCKNDEKVPFMNEKCDVVLQAQILNKMFKCMISLSKEQNNDNVMSLSNDEIKDLLNFDTNLFAAYGNKKTLNSVQRENKIKEYQKEIELLKNLLEAKGSNDVNDTPLLENDLNEELLRNMRSVEINLPEYKRNVVSLMKIRNKVNTREVSFKENFAEILEKNSKQIEIVSDFVESINILKDFIENHVDSKPVIQNRSGLILGEISDLCNKVSTQSN